MIRYLLYGVKCRDIATIPPGKFHVVKRFHTREEAKAFKKEQERIEEENSPRYRQVGFWGEPEPIVLEYRVFKGRVPLNMRYWYDAEGNPKGNT